MNKMKATKVIISIMVVWMVVALLCLVQSCATLQQAGTLVDTPEKKYLAARTWVNKNLKLYLDKYDISPKEVQQKWAKTIDPVFKGMLDTLDAWGATAKYGLQDPRSEAEFLKAKNNLMTLLIEVFGKQPEQ